MTKMYKRKVDDEWRKVKVENGKIYFEDEKGKFHESPFKGDDLQSLNVWPI